MFSSSELKLSIITFFEKINFLKNKESIILLKKAFENIIQVIFKQN